MIRFALSIALAFLAFASVTQAQAPDPQNTLVIELKTGKVLIKLRPDLAPKHVERVKRSPSRASTTASSSIASSTASWRRPAIRRAPASGGSRLPDLPAEFTREAYKRGSVGAARTANPNSANSQFFICYDGCRPLTGQYTLWGEVIEGMDHVDKIARGEPPPRPDVMLKVYLLADAKK